MCFKMETLFKVVLVPWLLASSSTSLKTERHTEDKLLQVLRCASMPPERVHAATSLVQDLQRALQERWPGSKVVMFGSLGADIAIRSSDVDCFVRLPQGAEPNYFTVSEARDLLAIQPNVFHHLYAIPDGPVPVLRFTHAPTDHRCEVSFRSSELIIQTDAIKYILQLDDRARQLCIIIKYWAHVNKPPGAKRIMPNYGMVLLVIFYLQQRHILPPLITLQKNTENITIGHWEMGYNRATYHSSNNETLFELLSGFFKFYAHFDFENQIISTFNGTAIDRRVFQRLDTIPGIYDTYKRNVGRNITRPLNISTPVCIQNFLQHTENLGVSVTRELFGYFRTILKFAAETIDEREHSLEYIFNGSDCFKDYENTNKSRLS